MANRLICLMIAVVVIPGGAHAGPNANTTLVLHAVQTQFGPCAIEDPCEPAPGSPSILILEPGLAHAVYVLVRNYSVAAGVQLAMDVAPSWVFMYGLWDCIGDIGPTAPGPPWGPTAGTASVLFFDLISGGATRVVGRLHFAVLGAGCMDIVESAFPFGTHVMGPQYEPEAIDPSNRGRVCVGPGGINTCEPAPVPVEASTWGAIKEQFDEPR
jgi:hypothetical protein